jgi:hypothetical protein
MTVKNVAPARDIYGATYWITKWRGAGAPAHRPDSGR